MPSLNLDVNYFDHPKVRKLVDDLGHEAAAMPIRLWCHAAKFFPDDGVLRGMSDLCVADVMGMCARCRHDVKLMWVSHLISHGFLDRLDNGELCVHDWKDHTNHIRAYRKRAKAAAAARWSDASSMVGKDASSIANNDASSIADSLPNAMQCNAVPNNTNIKSKASSVFKPPTKTEVSDYSEEINAGIDPEAFIAFYESNGWKVGKNPMKSWKAAVRTWKCRAKANEPEDEYDKPHSAEDIAEIMKIEERIARESSEIPATPTLPPIIIPNSEDMDEQEILKLEEREFKRRALENSHA